MWSNSQQRRSIPRLRSSLLKPHDTLHTNLHLRILSDAYHVLLKFLMHCKGGACHLAFTWDGIVVKDTC
jgi:hypothetical protein